MWMKMVCLGLVCLLLPISLPLLKPLKLLYNVHFLLLCTSLLSFTFVELSSQATSPLLTTKKLQTLSSMHLLHWSVLKHSPLTCRKSAVKITMHFILVFNTKETHIERRSARCFSRKEKRISCSKISHQEVYDKRARVSVSWSVSEMVKTRRKLKCAKCNIVYKYPACLERHRIRCQRIRENKSKRGKHSTLLYMPLHWCYFNVVVCMAVYCFCVDTYFFNFSVRTFRNDKTKNLNLHHPSSSDRHLITMSPPDQPAAINWEKQSSSSSENLTAYEREYNIGQAATAKNGKFLCNKK